jgi:hypothetical protein
MLPVCPKVRPPATSTLPLGNRVAVPLSRPWFIVGSEAGGAKLPSVVGVGAGVGDEDDEPPPHPARTMMKESRTAQQAIAPALREALEFTGLRSSGSRRHVNRCLVSVCKQRAHRNPRSSPFIGAPAPLFYGTTPICSGRRASLASLAIAYRRYIDSLRQPPSAIATERGTPARSMLRAAMRRKSCGTGLS